MPVQAIYYYATTTQIGTSSDFTTMAVYNIPFFLWLLLAIIMFLVILLLKK